MTTEAADVPPRRMDRRKARTRAALVGAAQAFLAEGRSAVSIQEITDAADVGFGSFYNHFATKDELFDAAVSAALEAHDAVLELVTAGIDDPAELFSIGVRTTGRLQRSAPEIARVILSRGTAILRAEEGIAPRARSDIAAGIASGRFSVVDAELAFMAVGGALLGMTQMLEDDPDADAGVAADRLAESLLRMLGLTPRQAGAVVAKALPDAG